jgi:hypothetical protein
MNRILYFTGAVLLIIAGAIGVARAEFGRGMPGECTAVREHFRRRTLRTNSI